MAELRARIADPHSAEGDFYNLWTLLLLEIWARTFLDPTAPEPYVSALGECNNSSASALPPIRAADVQASHARIF